MKTNLVLIDGVLLLAHREGEGVRRFEYLGEPRESLYYELPAELWPELRERLAEYREAAQYGQDCRDEVDASYRRAKGC